ncbi:MAG: hypothetical protein GC192_24005 [Bacteroidetes bacterium]|nr:hypothetical protein [Bacteroidota bacterium]
MAKSTSNGINLEEIHKSCGEIFSTELLESPNGRSLACGIWDAMIGDDGSNDNCIGENFNQLIQTLKSGWFEGYIPNGGTRIQFYTYTYIFWLYLFLERIEVILNEIDPERSYAPINDFYRKLNTMNEIRLWANFIKHPKNFIFVHWPDFTFVGQVIRKNANTKIINTAYLKNHYSNEKQNKPDELDNNDDVVVQFPKLVVITKGFCDDLTSFINFICDNKMLRDKLRIKSNRKN